MYGAAAEIQTRSRYVMTAMTKPNQSSVMRARDIGGRIVAELPDGHRCGRARQSQTTPPAVSVPALRRLVSRSDQRRLRRAADERGARLLERDLLARRGHLLSRVHAARDSEQPDPCSCRPAPVDC